MHYNLGLIESVTKISTEDIYSHTFEIFEFCH